MIAIVVGFMMKMNDYEIAVCARELQLCDLRGQITRERLATGVNKGRLLQSYAIKYVTT